VPTKRGTLPRLYGLVAGTGIEVGLRVHPAHGIEVQAEQQSNEQRLNNFLKHQEETLMMFPRGFNPPERLMSRFLAKMGLEELAQRFSHDMTLIRMLVDEQHYDRIRNWARRGDYPTNWPIHSRQIYPEDRLMRHPDNNEWVQAGFGYDLLMTRRRETFFVFGLYGYEFVINMGGPSIKGYIEWLKDHTMISPLVERLGFKTSASGRW
jgi:hypothetical protein